MTLLRWVGWLLAVAAFGCIGTETMLYFRDGTYEVLTLGRIWSEADRGSLLRVYDMLSERTRGDVPAGVFAGLLGLPGWALAGVPAVAALWAAGPSRRSRAMREDVPSSTVPAPDDP